MDLIYLDLRGFKVGPSPKIPFLGQLCQPYWQCPKDLKFNKFHPNHNALHWSMYWQFHWYKNKQKWWEMVQEKQNYEKSSFFLHLNKRTIFEHLVWEETNTDILGFTFQNPFAICKWVLGEKKAKYQYCRKPPNTFWFSNMLISFKLYLYQRYNFSNYKFGSSRFSNISHNKFPPKLQSYISNDM